MERRWSRQERDARIANRFDRGPNRVSVNISTPPPIVGYTSAHLHDAYIEGREAGRRGR